MPAEQVPEGIDVKTPNVARIYDYFLGGKDNYAADRTAAERILEMVPEAPQAARANRAFLGRAVRTLAREAGIRQFVDIGAGLPTQGNVHEIAHAVAPDSHVVYVDNDPVVLTHARARLARDRQTVAIAGDLRRPEEILADPVLGELIDLNRPVAVLLLAVLHFIADEDDPVGVMKRLTERLPSGSHLVISHGWDEGMDSETAEEARAVWRRSNSAIHSRDPERVAEFFTGLEILEPGVVWISEWRPDHAVLPGTAPEAHILGAVGRKP